MPFERAREPPGLVRVLLGRALLPLERGEKRWKEIDIRRELFFGATAF
jgi:hypothetical protein